MDLINILSDNEVIATITGEWADASRWVLKDIRIQAGPIEPFGLSDAIYKNRYGAMAIGGIIPSSAAYRWETLKIAVRRYCQHLGFDYEILIEDPPYKGPLSDLIL